jgi:hypothetical protein
MNKRQRNYFRMFASVQEYLDSHSSIWMAIIRIVTYKNGIDEIIERIVAKSEVAGALLSVTNRKDTLRRLIAIKASILSGAIQSFAYDTKDLDLAAKIGASLSVVDKMKEEELMVFIKVLTDTAELHSTILSEFGVSAEGITEIKTTMAEYGVMIGKPRSILNTKYVAIDTIDDLIDEGKKLLNNQMDNTMLMYRESNKEFYNGYERSRVIVDR